MDDITAADDYKQIIAVIEETHAYLKEARLEQAFDAAIFRGRRRPGQTLTGFLATKKAALAELKKQDMLAADAGNHLLGHLLLKQGGFTLDQQQRVRVLTGGSIEFWKIELSIQKIFGDSLDDTQARTYWESAWNDDEDDGQGDYESYFGGSGYDGDAIVMSSVLNFDSNTGEVYIDCGRPAPGVSGGDGSHRVCRRIPELGLLRDSTGSKEKARASVARTARAKALEKGRATKVALAPPGTGFDRQNDQRPRMSLEQLQARSSMPHLSASRTLVQELSSEGATARGQSATKWGKPARRTSANNGHVLC